VALRHIAETAFMVYRHPMQSPMLTVKDKEVARHIQGDIPVDKHPFQMIGDAVGLSEAKVLAIVNRLKRQGIIRKFCAIVRHQRVGYEKNAMVVWAAPETSCEVTGKMFASCREITHCYERKPPFEGRYNLFTMVHFRNDNPDDLIQKLADLSGIRDYKILLSIEEFKKSSMVYF
jgi:siroheme decarboxylase